MAESELAALSREVQRQFEAELEPHFRIEERWLLPALEAKGGARLAAQTVADHEHLRVLVRGDWSKDTAHELGTRLEKHVRFEERVLFPEAQACLSEAELARIRDAATNRNNDGERRSP